MDTTANKKKYFTRQLMLWHSTENFRSLPWKNEKDPYKIWLSEIILQQTRAQQALPYYLRFIDTYPTISDMANAKEKKVYRLWQGLGYYNRCKNMLATARQISNELKGKFPSAYEEILQLKGIGPYTASAIASFAFGAQHAVVDGNVYRILSRYFGIETPFDTAKGKKIFSQLAYDLLHRKDSASYNQAIMDLGATICKPKNPVCDDCILKMNCLAYSLSLIDSLPVRNKKLTIRRRYFHYLVLQWKDSIWIHKRTGKDIWQNLYEPYLIEHDHVLNKEDLMSDDLILKNKHLFNNIEYKNSLSQKLTHQLLESHFFVIHLSGKPKITYPKGKWVSINSLHKVALPKTIISFFKKNVYF